MGRGRRDRQHRLLDAVCHSGESYARSAAAYVGGYQTIDTAYAGAYPCPLGHGPSPWPAVAVIVGVVGVITNAAWIWHTQCRELSSQEAMTSTFLPFVGMAFDAQASKCH